MSEIKRQTELDILRLLATLAVIMIHGGLNPLTDNLMIKYMYRGMHAAIVWCVPVFFMISGRFFLDPERDVSAKKNTHCVPSAYYCSLPCLVRRIYGIRVNLRELQPFEHFRCYCRVYPRSVSSLVSLFVGRLILIDPDSEKGSSGWKNTCVLSDYVCCRERCDAVSYLCSENRRDDFGFY